MIYGNDSVSSETFSLRWVNILLRPAGKAVYSVQDHKSPQKPLQMKLLSFRISKADF